MASFGQVCFTTSKSDPLIYVCNIYTGTILKTFKQNVSSSQGSGLLFDQGGNPTGFISLQTDSKIINLWSLLKESPTHKFILNQKFTSISTSPNGNWLAGGTGEGSFLLWDLHSGDLVSSFHAHYSAISVIKFSFDSRLVVSGSQDGSVHVWFLNRIFSTDSVKIKPQIYWTDHLGTISDIFITRYSFEQCKILTCSADSYCHLYSAYSDNKICSFKLPTPATCCTVNSMESSVVVGGKDGNVYFFEINTLRQRITNDCTLLADSGSGCKVLSTHEASITSLSFSPDELILLSASDDGTISCWDSNSLQLLRKISFFKGPIANIYCTVLPVDFTQCKNFSPSSIAPSLKRTVNNDDSTITTLLSSSSKETLKIHPMIETSSQLEHSLTQLQQEHSKLLAMYDELYSLTTNNFTK